MLKLFVFLPRRRRSVSRTATSTSDLLLQNLEGDVCIYAVYDLKEKEDGAT